MADEPTQEPSSFDSSSGAGEEEVSEQELDDLLAEASALAGEISAGVGEPESEADDSGDENLVALPQDASADAMDGRAGDVDTRLVELDSLLSEADAQLGVSHGPDAPDHPPEPDDHQDRPSVAEGSSVPTETPEPQTPVKESADFRPGGEGRRGDELPDSFMSDLSEPRSDKTPLTDSANPNDPPDKTVSRPPNAPTRLDDGTGERTAGPSSGDDFVGPDQGKPGGPRLLERLAGSAPARRGAQHISSLAWLGCERGAALLEIMDRPTQRLGVGFRQAIGWLALATLGTSLIVFLISLF